MAIEKPKYTVLKKDRGFEIREYDAQFLAQVDGSGTWNEALNRGFRILADYIFGGNETGAKIAMTAPVTTTRSGKDSYRISFMMPRKYTIDKLPEPNSGEIEFVELEKHRAAVLKFSGYLNEELLGKKIDELKNWLGKEKLTRESEFISAQYNPPWTPGFFRKNEIIVKV
jgi:hypothetical protein